MKKLIYLFLIFFLSCFITKSQPVISYIIPDIGAPNMNTYLEIIGPYDYKGNFGMDAIFTNNKSNSPIRIEVENPADSNKLIFGPIVVSWEGRLISGQVFVNPSVRPNSSDWEKLSSQFKIPIRVFLNGKGYSNVDTFYIVNPQKLGNVTGINETILGEGLLGKRSRRGAMIVDSLILAGKTYRVSTIDCDTKTQGNQGYLPFILLSAGNISGQIATKIDMNGGYPTRPDASPGGGGGGGKFYDYGGNNQIGDNGGNGYVGGGPGGKNKNGLLGELAGIKNEFKLFGSSTYISGSSLNNQTPPSTGGYESSGGATAHPFGRSGEACNDGDNCKPVGGYGGGSGNSQTLAGGSAGNAIDGQGPNSSKGLAVGNAMLVPLAGGSGGASGNPQGMNNFSGNGGGGGGAISIYAQKIDFLTILAKGADGGNEPADGGSGAGGGVQLISKFASDNSNIDVNGGTLGAWSASYGRIRLDNLSGTVSIAPAVALPFEGFVTDTNHIVKRQFVLKGKKNPNQWGLKLFIKPEKGEWDLMYYISPAEENWSINIDLPGPDTLFYLSGIMDIKGPIPSGYLAEPIAILSQAGANILKIDKKSEILVSVDKIDYGLRSKCADVDTTFYIYNSPSASANLTILKRANIIGPDKDNFEISLEPGKIPVSIAPGDSLEYSVRYTAGAGSEGFKTATIQIETDSPTEPIIEIDLIAEREDLHLLVQPDLNIDYGNVWAGFTHDTIITVTNTGRLDHAIFDIITSDPDLTVFPYGGNLSANSGNSIDFKFSLKSKKSGTNNYWAKFILEYQCDDTLQVFFSATTNYSDYTIPDSLKFGELSPCDTKLDSFFIENKSNVPFIIKSISSIFGVDAALFSKLNPGITFPDTVFPNEKKAVYVTFTPSTAPDGNKVAFLNIDLTVNGENVTKIVYFTGKLSTGLVTIPPSIDFGRVIIFTNKTINFVIENIGPWEITVSNFTLAALFPTIYTYTNPGVIKLYVGDKLIIPITFSPVNIQRYDDSFRFSYQIGNCPIETKTVQLLGEGVPAVNFTLWMPEIFTDPDVDNLKIPIFAKVENPDDSLNGFNLDTLEISFNRTLFFPKSIEFNEGIILKNTINNDKRILTLNLRNISITSKDTVLGYLVGSTMLGNVDSTAIVIEKTSFTQKNLVSMITKIDGKLLINICKKGGDRLLDVVANPLGGIIKPNPTNGEFEINASLLEIGNYKVSLFDLSGNTLVLDEFIVEKDTSKEYNKNFDVTNFSSGLYRIVIFAPSEIYSIPLMIVK